MAAQSGYTLPVFATASALAAVRCLHHPTQPLPAVTLDLLTPPQTVTIPIEQVAPLPGDRALAITRSDPGDNLDLTRHTPIWAEVQYHPGPEILVIEGGEGIGKQEDGQGPAAIYAYARRLLTHHLTPYLRPGQTLTVTIILPQGRTLAQRTSNEAFGIVEGLSLLGTSGIAQPLSAPEQLTAFQERLQTLAQDQAYGIFCVGENGLDLVQRWGATERQIVKTGNWIGPMLVAAALAGMKGVLLVGYHGKLIKLAGGIFHTHHHVADGRLEILTAQAVQAGLPYPQVAALMAAPTTEAGLRYLRQTLTPQGLPWSSRIYDHIATTLDRRAQTYVQAVAGQSLPVGCILFDGDRHPVAISPEGHRLAACLGLSLPPLA